MLKRVSVLHLDITLKLNNFLNKNFRKKKTSF